MHAHGGIAVIVSIVTLDGFCARRFFGVFLSVLVGVNSTSASPGLRWGRCVYLGNSSGCLRVGDVFCSRGGDVIGGAHAVGRAPLRSPCDSGQPGGEGLGVLYPARGARSFWHPPLLLRRPRQQVSVGGLAMSVGFSLPALFARGMMGLRHRVSHSIYGLYARRG